MIEAVGCVNRQGHALLKQKKLPAMQSSVLTNRNAAAFKFKQRFVISVLLTYTIYLCYLFLSGHVMTHTHTHTRVLWPLSPPRQG